MGEGIGEYRPMGRRISMSELFGPRWMGVDTATISKALHLVSVKRGSWINPRSTHGCRAEGNAKAVKVAWRHFEKIAC
jgi:hypothetical protein